MKRPSFRLSCDTCSLLRAPSFSRGLYERRTDFLSTSRAVRVRKSYAVFRQSRPRHVPKGGGAAAHPQVAPLAIAYGAIGGLAPGVLAAARSRDPAPRRRPQNGAHFMTGGAP